MSRPRTASVLAALLTVGALILSGCQASAAAGGQVTVFAAASLTDAFEELADGFADDSGGITVRLNFAGSQRLAGQIEEGAPADVFASANQVQMDRLADGDLIDGDPRVFARNVLQIVVPAGNPAGVTELADLASPDLPDLPDLKVVLAAEEVPAGHYAREALAAADAGDLVEPVSLENDVRAVVTKVELGEADAGIVYATDVTAAGDQVEGVPIPEEHNVEAAYPVAVTAEAADPEGARAFVDFLLSDEGQAVLGEHGFLPAEG